MKKYLLILLCLSFASACGEKSTGEDNTPIDATIPEGIYDGTIFYYFDGKTKSIGITVRDNRFYISFIYPPAGIGIESGKVYSATYTVTREKIFVLNAIGEKKDDRGSETVNNIGKYIPLKYTYDEKRKQINSVDDDDNTIGDISVTWESILHN